MERLLFMNEPRWKALTENTHKRLLCLGLTTLQRSLRSLGSLNFDGSPQTLPVMVDATVTATLVLSDLTQVGGDTLGYCQEQRIRAQQGRGLRDRSMLCLHCC